MRRAHRACVSGPWTGTCCQPCALARKCMSSSRASGPPQERATSSCRPPPLAPSQVPHGHLLTPLPIGVGNLRIDLPCRHLPSGQPWGAPDVPRKHSVAAAPQQGRIAHVSSRLAGRGFAAQAPCVAMRLHVIRLQLWGAVHVQEPPRPGHPAEKHWTRCARAAARAGRSQTASQACWAGCTSSLGESTGHVRQAQVAMLSLRERCQAGCAPTNGPRIVNPKAAPVPAVGRGS